MSYVPILGIDLGSTFARMALVDEHGHPELIPNSEGSFATPSVVYFDGGDAPIVGEEAVRRGLLDPKPVARSPKRLMGEDLTLKFCGRRYTPQEISALVLKKLKEDAQANTGREIRDAVLTVPAHFGAAQRGATAEAAAIAGLNALSIINEPTAAAIAYGLERVGGQRKLLVLDLGGGSFDVTAMQFAGSKLSTLATHSIELGGKDWDDQLLEYVASEFSERHGTDPRRDPVFHEELYQRCLHAKISLSTKHAVVIPVNYRGKRLAVKVDRARFEALTEDLVQRCEEATRLVLGELSWPSFDDVLLVGGGFCMPRVRDRLGQLVRPAPREGDPSDGSGRLPLARPQTTYGRGVGRLTPGLSAPSTGQTPR